MIEGTMMVYMGFTFWLPKHGVSMGSNWAMFETTHECGERGKNFFCRKCGVCATEKELARLKSLIKLNMM